MGRKAEKVRMLILRAGKCSHGFTYLELIVVLFIISILTATVFPSFIIFSESKIKSEAKELASIIRYLSELATLKRETLYIRFDIDRNTISWKTDTGQKMKRLDSVFFVKTQSKGMVSKGEVVFFFEPDGAKENLDVYITDKKDEMLISFNYLSGRVKIKNEQRI
jgi:general secretion pathway protein H